ncbi:hypothetical protein ACT7DZ_17320 [Bacillus cereus]
MYELTIGLKYDEPLDLHHKYRYDFVGIGYQNNYIHGCIFVFRTIKKGKSTGNVLIDLVHNSNINALKAHIHGDCHFHMFQYRMSISNEPIKITDNISLEKVKNATNDEYYALIKEQKYKLINGVPAIDPVHKHFPEVKYLLLTEYHESIANMDTLELAPIFKLQEEHIWHNNRYSNYNDTSKLDVDDNNLNSSIKWSQVKEIIKNKRKHFEKQSEEKTDQIFELKNSVRYRPIE